MNNYNIINNKFYIKINNPRNSLRLQLRALLLKLIMAMQRQGNLPVAHSTYILYVTEIGLLTSRLLEIHFK